MITIPIVEGNTGQGYAQTRFGKVFRYGVFRYEVFRYERAFAATVIADFDAKTDLAIVMFVRWPDEFIRFAWSNNTSS